MLEGEKQAVELAKNPDALVHLVEKTAALVATAVQAGQVLSPGKNGHVFYGNSVTAHLQIATTQHSDVQAMQKPNGRDWAVVN